MREGGREGGREGDRQTETERERDGGREHKKLIALECESTVLLTHSMAVRL